jgi:hypothetical protein
MIVWWRCVLLEGGEHFGGKDALHMDIAQPVHNFVVLNLVYLPLTTVRDTVCFY